MAVDAKICGLTRPLDAAAAAALGAWRLGVVFASGPRVITVARAREIVDAGGGVPVLGVFGPEPIQSILDKVGAAGLAGAQLHGAHHPSVARALRDAGIEVWNVVPVDERSDIVVDVGGASEAADAVVIEARVAGGSGGKGIPVALELARQARAAMRQGRFVLSGGLTPDRLANAIATVHPDTVDVSSGIEIEVGIKDLPMMARFLEIARAASAGA